MVALSVRRSASGISPVSVISEHDATDTWLRFFPSPITLAKNGEPLMCLSPNRTETLYSPGAVGRYVIPTVPSLLSLYVI